MGNENKKNNKKEYRNDENIASTFESINLPTGILAQYEAIESINNDINALTNSLAPIIEMTNRHEKIWENATLLYQSINPFETFIKLMPPIDLIEKYTLTQSSLIQIHNSFNIIDWNLLNSNLNSILYSINHIHFDLILTNKKIVAKIIYEYVCEINDEEISSVFSYEFILKIIMDDWWIIPTFDLEYYKRLSKMDGNFNQSFLNEFYDNPTLIKDMVMKWDMTSIMRRKIINQALFNYMEGNYEICVIVLVLQIEGIMKEKISHKKSFRKLRSSLEQKLINNASNNDPWNTFLNKANIDYIWNVLKPLGKHMDLKEEKGRVNRNVIAHTGVVEANQLIAMRLFFIIDTLMYILETI